MVLKKWLTISVCLFTSLLSAKNSDQTHTFLSNPKGVELNIKVIRFFATHPKTSEYLFHGTEALASVLEKYNDETQQLIKKYPNERASSLAEKRVSNIQYFLDNREVFSKVGFFLFLGVYDLDAYQDTKTWKQLIKTQDSIFSHYIKRAQAKANFESFLVAKNEGNDPLEKLELELMANIKAFCQKSSDPFFHTTLYLLIKDCQTREKVLKLFAPIRDETAIDEESGEVFSEGEGAYQMLNEKMWLELKRAVKKYFDRKETLEYCIEVVSDTFDIPNYP